MSIIDKMYDLYLDIQENLPKEKLIEACEDDELDRVKKFLKFRFIFPLNGKGDLGTPLTRSISTEMIKLLLKNGAKVNQIVRDSEIQHGRKRIDEHTALCSYQAINNEPEIIEYLLKNNADPNISLTRKSIKGQTPLFIVINNGEHYASYHKKEHLRKIGLLIEYGADVNKQDENFDTPITSFLKTEFSYSSFTGEGYKKEIIELLINNGAKIDIKNKQGETALSIAKEKQFNDVEAILIKEGAQIHDNKQRKQDSDIKNKTNKKVKQSQLQCNNCSETYNFKTLAGMMTDEKVAAIFSNAKINVINNSVNIKPDLINKKYTFISKVFRFLGDGKGVPKHVRYCFRNGISRKWTCEKCQNVNEYPDSFIKYWSR